MLPDPVLLKPPERLDPRHGRQYSRVIAADVVIKSYGLKRLEVTSGRTCEGQTRPLLTHCGGRPTGNDL
jgi:hypothetical protein